MKTRYIIRRAGRSLRHAKARTLLTSLAIAVGAFTLTLSIAAGEGARQYADKLISSNIDPQMLLIAKDGSLFGEGQAAGPGGGLREYSENSASFGGMTLKALDAKDLETIKANKNIEKVTPSYLVSAQYLTFEGMDKKYTTDITVYDSSVKAEAAAGMLPGLGEQIGDNDMVIPEAFVTALNKKPEDIVGKKVTLHLVKPAPEATPAQIQQAFATGGAKAVEKLTIGEVRDATFTVRAVSAQSATSFSASAALFISENQAKDLSEFLTKGTSSYQKYISVGAKVKQGVDPATVKEELAAKDIKSRTAEDLQGLLFTIVDILQGIVAGFGILALIASVFGIINTQYISVLERTQQIGLVKALGMRGRDVAFLFLYEAAWIGFLGGIIGSALAVGMGTLLNPWITETIGLGEGNYILIFQLIPIIMLIVSLMLVAVVAGYLPARKAAKLDPIEALRTE